MDRKQFGKLVAALRKEQYDENGDRCTQSKLADWAQELDPTTPLNEIIIGKIERGERTILDEQTLLNLADALKLAVGERRVFFMLATGLDHPQIYPNHDSSDDLLAPVLEMLAEIRLPALLVDRYLDVIAVNGLLLKLYQLSHIELMPQITQKSGTNLLNFIFSDAFAPMRAEMSPQVWHRFAVGIIMDFRRVTMPYRMTPYFGKLLAHLRKNREFRWYWEQVLHEDKIYFVGGELFQLGPPLSGRLRFLTTPLVNYTKFGNLEILTHIPRDEETAVSFHEMATDVPSQVYQFGAWPEKVWS